MYSSRPKRVRRQVMRSKYATLIFTYLHGTALVVHLVDTVHWLLRSSQQRREDPETHGQQVGPRARRCAVVYLVLTGSGYTSGLSQQHLHQHPQHVGPREAAAATLLRGQKPKAAISMRRFREATRGWKEKKK